MITLTSPAFATASRIPLRYTCDGGNVSLPLSIDNIHPAAKSLVLIMDDPDSKTKGFVHWLVWNIKAVPQVISEGKLSEGAVEGTNSFGKCGYGGPCPQVGTHRYFIKLLALDLPHLDLPAGAVLADVMKAIDGHVVDYAVLIGLYSR